MDLVAAGQRALDTAIAEWNRRVVDPPRRTWEDGAWTPSRTAIDGYIRSRMGLDWPRCSWVPPVVAYRRDGDFEWCGAFAAWCWRHAGLDPELAYIYWSSTYRLDRYARRAVAFGSLRERRLRARLDGLGRLYLPFEADTTYDDVERFAPRAGDVLIVNGIGVGQHITIVESWDPDLGGFRTVEGNATGRGPDVTLYQGVVKQLRRFHTCRRLIRPAASDLTEAR
ncbi:MAG: CHAP domain-containing protein [Deltaproteobacteria bacterium]|nr:CHAP domain-containing protein [Deltaproteobacteria bacterium]